MADQATKLAKGDAVASGVGGSVVTNVNSRNTPTKDGTTTSTNASELGSLVPAYNNSTGSKRSTPTSGRIGVLSRLPSERSGANMFRSNVEGIEKPRQIIALVVTVAGASYLGFSQNDDDPESNARAATMGASLIFLVHCFLQCRDSLFFRPHPGVWRIVHGIGMLYLFAIAILLFHPKHEARRLLMIFIPDVKGYEMSRADLLASTPLNCDLTAAAVLSQLREVWFLAHLVGWWCKMCLFRDWGVCWVLSVGFELLELSMGWLVPQFHECWWDSLIIDLLGANLLGMTLGLYTLRFLETRTYDWNRQEESRKLTGSLRLLAKFSPFRWSKWRWQAFSSLKRTAQVFAMIAVTMLLELNAFMVMNALEIPKTSNFNYVRLSVVFLVALVACSEYYEYCSNPDCSRLGQNLWLVLAILQVEILLWIKFFPQPLLEASSPDDVKLPWLATLSLFSLWGLLFFAVSKDNDNNNNNNNSCFSNNGGRAEDSERLLASQADGCNRQKSAENDGNSTGSGREGSGSDVNAPPRRNSKGKKVMQVVKWGAVDGMFMLSFMPLLYLVKQWSY